RRLNQSEVARFLNDSDPNIVLEAARAINDVPIDNATAALANQIEKPITDERIGRRVMQANYRTGSSGAAQALVRFALDKNRPEPLRIMAVQLLGQWGGPTGRDRVTGAWRPLADRDRSPARQALSSSIDALFIKNG